MSNEIADGDDPGSESPSDLAQEVNGIAFLLVSAAYLMLADARLRSEGPAGLAVMDEIEGRIEEVVESFIAEHSYDVGRPDLVLRAAEKVRALFEAARSVASRDVQ
ncbi:hypothetical protein ACRAWG_19355 [Methylobacterium sp. P31]